MLQKIRTHAQGWIAWGIVLLIAATFIFWGVGSRVSGGSHQRVIAKVNGEEIHQQEVDVQYERIIHRVGRNDRRNQINEQIIREQALKALINNAVMQQAMHALGLSIAPAQVRNVITQIPEFKDKEQFSIDRYQEVLRLARYSDAEFRNEIKNAMLLTQLQLGVRDTAMVFDADVVDAIELIDQKRSINYVILPFAPFKTKSKVEAQAIKDYYQKHQDNYYSKQRVKLEYIELSLPELLSQAKVSDNEAKDYYENNKDSFKQAEQRSLSHILLQLNSKAKAADEAAAKEKIAAIKSRLDKGEDFAKLAEELSEDTASAKQKGFLGWFALGELDEDFEKTAFALEKIGDVSEPIRTEYGYQIIKLNDIKAAKQQSLAEAKKKIIELLRHKYAEEVLANQGETLASMAFEQPNTLVPISEKLGLKIQESDWFTEEGGEQGIARNPLVVDVAFSEDVLKAGNNSDIIEIDSEHYAVVRLKSYEAAKQLDFDVVKAEIEAALTEEQAKLDIENAGKVLIAQLQAGADPNDALKEFKQSWAKRKITRSDTVLDTEVVQLAFEVPRPRATPVIHYKGTLLANNNYAIVALSDVENGNPDTLNKDLKASYAEGLSQGLGDQEFQALTQSFLDSAKIWQAGENGS